MATLDSMPLVLQVFEPFDGGVPEHVLLLADGLRDRGFRSEIVGPQRSQIDERARAAGLTVHTLPFVRDYRHPWRDADGGMKLRRLLDDRGPAIVHCHASKAGAIGRVAAARLDVGVVYTPHCFGFVGDVGLVRRNLVPQLERGLARLTDRIVCVCRAELEIARSQRIGAPEQLAVIPYGIPTPRPDVQPDSELARLARGGPLLANIAALRHQKRQDVFLHAAAIVLRTHPDARVALVGNGPLDVPLREQAARLGLDREPRFAFLPFASPVEPYLAALDVFVLCSDWEALPIALLEALGAGVPQIGTAVFGTPEIITPETGCLVPAGDARALASAMLGLIEGDVNLVAMSSASRARQREVFSVERMLTQTATLYRDVLRSA